jgi:hypothetical protein
MIAIYLGSQGHPKPCQVRQHSGMNDIGKGVHIKKDFGHFYIAEGKLAKSILRDFFF